MEDQKGWKVVNNIKKPKRVPRQKKIIVVDDNVPQTTQNIPNTSNLPETLNQDCGDKLSLQNNYVLWCHDIYNKDWTLAGYVKLCTVKTVADFWKLFNNLDKLGYKLNNFFLMKEGTDPIWEHENNRGGGICSFRIDMDSSLQMYEDLCSRMICNLLTNNMDDINGISFGPKNNWAIIKIWNKDKVNDLSKTLDAYILDTYKDTSIKYKENEPEF